MGNRTGIDALLQLPVRKLCRRPMSEFTSLRVGGEAEVILFPRDIDQLLSLVSTARESGVPLYPVGGGTNLLVKDGGIRGAVVSLTGGFNYVKIEKSEASRSATLRAGAGAGLGRICLIALQQRLEGLEGLIGIPGSLGGCLTMNAGADSTSIGDKVHRVRMLSEDGEMFSFPGEEINFGYRRAQYPTQGIIVEAELMLMAANGGDLRQRALEAAGKRSLSKWIRPFNAGSVFKNPPGAKAGALIEGCGLKGEREGDAQISPLHGNIIVNRGRATAGEVLRLMDRARETVLARRGIELEEEIKVVGD